MQRNSARPPNLYAIPTELTQEIKGIFAFPSKRDISNSAARHKPGKITWSNPMTVKIGGPLTESEIAEVRKILTEYQPDTPRQIAQFFACRAEDEDREFRESLYRISSLMFRYAAEFLPIDARTSRHAGPVQHIAQVV